MLSKEYLSEYFRYDEESPSGLVWNKTMYALKDKGKINALEGDKAGAWSASAVKNNGSWNVSVNKQKLKVHRIIYQLHFNDLTDDYVIDHIDGNPKNNNIDNLRKVTQKINMRNLRKRVDNKSGVTGVILYTRKNRSPYFEVGGVDADGNKIKKTFTVSVLGKEGAFMEAIAFRNKILDDAANYDINHGQFKGERK